MEKRQRRDTGKKLLEDSCRSLLAVVVRREGKGAGIAEHQKAVSEPVRWPLGELD